MGGALAGWVFQALHRQTVANPKENARLIQQVPAAVSAIRRFARTRSALRDCS